MDAIDDFLAHYGVKGMRWGVRRSDAQLAKAEKKYVTKKDAVLRVDEKGNVSVKGGTFRDRRAIKKNADDIIDADNAAKKLSKTEDGKEAKDVHVSADAERFIKTRQKEGHEMSDREIREALNRAKMVKEYDEMFSVTPSSGLKQKVEALKLQKEYSQLKAEMNPTRIQRTKNFIDSANSAFESYQKLDKVTGGALSKKFEGTFALSAAGGKHKK